MGRYSAPLAVEFADFAGIERGRVLDVGCGPGAFTAELVRRVGAANVAAADPSETFVAAASARNPGVDVRQAPAEELPFPDGGFDAALAQLVFHFVTDPPRAAAEMRRVTRSGGTVAACVWDYGGRRGALSRFWDVARELDPGAGETVRFGSSEGELEQLFREAALLDVDATLISVTVRHDTFDDWWEPYTDGSGPVGTYMNGLGEAGRERLREHARAGFPDGGLDLVAAAWAARGRVP